MHIGAYSKKKEEVHGLFTCKIWYSVGIEKVCCWPATKGQWYTTFCSWSLWTVSHGSSKFIARKRIESSWFYFSVENWSRNKAKHFVSPLGSSYTFLLRQTHHIQFSSPTADEREIHSENQQEQPDYPHTEINRNLFTDLFLSLPTVLCSCKQTG